MTVLDRGDCSRQVPLYLDVGVPEQTIPLGLEHELFECFDWRLLVHIYDMAVCIFFFIDSA